jgi:hypothetical protein
LIAPLTDLTSIVEPLGAPPRGQDDLCCALEKVQRCLRLPITADCRRVIGVIVEEALNPKTDEE